MKIIKSAMLVGIGLFTSTALLAQQEEVKNIKPLPAQLTKSPAADARSATPEIKMIDEKLIVNTPSPFVNENNAKIPGQENITLKSVDPKEANSQLTAEQLKTLNGIGTLPKQSAGTPATVNVKPMSLLKPVLAKEQ